MSSSKKVQPVDLSTLLNGLNDSGVEYIVVGGLAAVIQGVPISTFDLDIVHRQTDANIKKLMQFLESVDAIHRRPDDKKVYPQEGDLRGKGHLLLMTKFGPLDILAVIEKGQGYDELMPSTVTVDYKGHQTYILSLETLVAIKRDSGIPEDRYRIQIYKETLRLKKEAGRAD